MKLSTASALFWLATPVLLLSGPSAAPAGQELAMQINVQAPRDARAAQPAPAGSASITGSVIVAGSGQPARKARVSLSGGGLRGTRTALTDELGRFVFAALPEGRYSVSASKPGHVSVQYGQRVPGPGRPGTPIQLGEAQEIDVRLQMPKGGVITGTVLDEHGEAVPGTQVRTLRYVLRGGERTLQQAGRGSTDDRGVYRIYGLQPGEYIVAATPRNTINIQQIEALRSQVEEIRARAQTLGPEDAAAALATAERVSAGLGGALDAEQGVTGYAPVYYPGTTMPGGASPVAVGIGDEKMGIDFSLQLVPIAQIEGLVVTSTAEPVQSIQVSLINIGHNVPGMGNTTARPDREGRFRLRNVAPGQYILTARGTLRRAGGRGQPGQWATEAAGARSRTLTVRAAVQAQTTRLWAMTPVVVDGRNLSNIVLNLQHGMTVSGRLVFEGTSTLPADLTRLRVSASPADPAGPARQIAASASVRADAGGRFTIPGVPPGRYRLTAAGAGGSWRLGSAMVGSADALDFPFEVKPNENVTDAVLTFTDRSTELAGAIVDERGQPASDYTIIVFPADQQFWTPNSRRILSQRPGTDGRFTFRNLPAGDYRIAPVLDPEPGSWYDPALLQQLDIHALRVPLADGESKLQNLRVDGR